MNITEGDRCLVNTPNYYLRSDDGLIGKVIEVDREDEFVFMNFKTSKNIIVYYTEITKVLSRQNDPEYFL